MLGESSRSMLIIRTKKEFIVDVVHIEISNLFFSDKVAVGAENPHTRKDELLTGPMDEETAEKVMGWIEQQIRLQSKEGTGNIIINMGDCPWKGEENEKV